MNNFNAFFGSGYIARVYTLSAMKKTKFGIELSSCTAIAR